MVDKQHIANFWGQQPMFDRQTCSLSHSRAEVHLFKPPDFDETEAQGDGHRGVSAQEGTKTPTANILKM